MIDPTDIERGQAEAIRAARRAASDDPSALLIMILKMNSLTKSLNPQRQIKEV